MKSTRSGRVQKKKDEAKSVITNNINNNVNNITINGGDTSSITNMVKNLIQQANQNVQSSSQNSGNLENQSQENVVPNETAVITPPTIESLMTNDHVQSGNARRNSAPNQTLRRTTRSGRAIRSETVTSTSQPERILSGNLLGQNLQSLNINGNLNNFGLNAGLNSVPDVQLRSSNRRARSETITSNALVNQNQNSSPDVQNGHSEISRSNIATPNSAPENLGNQENAVQNYRLMENGTIVNATGNSSSTAVIFPDNVQAGPSGINHRNLQANNSEVRATNPGNWTVTTATSTPNVESTSNFVNPNLVLPSRRVIFSSYISFPLLLIF